MINFIVEIKKPSFGWVFYDGIEVLEGDIFKHKCDVGFHIYVMDMASKCFICKIIIFI